MDLFEAIDARWGGPAGTDLDSEQVRDVDLRNEGLWNRISSFSGSKAQSPLVHSVHSAHALPALLGHQGHPRIVWDAGLGTLFDWLSFPLPYAQSEQVLEAMLRRICAVRLASAMQAAKARRYAEHSRELITAHPIDRTRQLLADAEGQFNVWLTTELQEQFALAHEQMHYLRRVDPSAFDELQAKLVSALDSRTLSNASDDSPLMAPLESNSLDRRIWLHEDRYLDPDSWYLHSWIEGTSHRVEIADWAAKADRVQRALETQPRLLLEAVCDVFGALAVCIESHHRQRGWDATTAAASSRVALGHLGIILRIDILMSIRPASAVTSKAGIALRADCMELVLPVLLHEALGPDEEIPSTADLREVMRLAGERTSEIHSSSMQVIEETATEPDEEAEIATRADFINSIFLNLRPSPSSRSGVLFHLGVVDLTPSIRTVVQSVDAAGIEIEKFLARHERGDWGEIYEEDAQANLSAIGREFEALSEEEIRRYRGDIWSFYRIQGTGILIKTNRERTLTTVLTSADL